MINIYRFSTWNQLSGLKSILYPNLQINVVQFNSEHLEGTKIDIVDIENNILYFTGFVRIIRSDRFDPLAVFEIDDMIKRINAYGFNIDIEEPTTLQPNVITILRGLHTLGYNYITLQYSNETANGTVRSIYQSDIDYTASKTPWPHWIQHPFIAFSNKYVVATKTLSDVRRVYNKKQPQPINEDVYNISEAPNFSWEDYKWLQPTRVYSIELLINPEATSDTPISDAIVDVENLPGTGD